MDRRNPDNTRSSPGRSAEAHEAFHRERYESMCRQQVRRAFLRLAEKAAIPSALLPLPLTDVERIVLCCIAYDEGLPGTGHLAAIAEATRLPAADAERVLQQLEADGWREKIRAALGR